MSGTAEKGDDERLLAAARGGDREALEALLIRYQPRVYRFGLRMCRDPEDASEVLQDTLLTVARSLGGFRGEASLSTWLYTIARSFCVKRRRRSKFAPREEVPLDTLLTGRGNEPEDRAANPEETAVGREVQAALEGAIGALEPRYREVLLLRDVEGLTAPEVARVLGITVEAVKSRLHRARLAVRTSVAPALGAPGPAAGPGARTCPDVLTLLSRHLEGELSPEVCAEMEKHLERCARCRGACESLRRTLAACRAAPTPAVPERVTAAIQAALRDFLDQSST